MPDRQTSSRVSHDDAGYTPAMALFSARHSVFLTLPFDQVMIAHDLSFVVAVESEALPVHA